MAKKPKGGDGAQTTVEPEQVSFELPDYHGRKPTGMRTSISGTGNRTTKSHGIGDRFVLVAEVKCMFAGHKEVDGKLVYVENYSVSDMFEVEDGKAGARLVVAMRARARATSDTGVRTALEGDDVDMSVTGWTDASGVVLTPDEVAAIQGNPVAAFGPVPDTAILITEDGRRTLWPDEYPSEDRPSIGESVNGSPVAAILDGITGECIEGELPGITGEEAAVWTGEPTFTVDNADRDADPDAIPEAHLPTKAEFDFVKAHAIGALRDELEDITDPDELHRLLNAERQGRGDGSKPRDGAVKAIEARIAYVTQGVKLKLVKED